MSVKVKTLFCLAWMFLIGQIVFPAIVLPEYTAKQLTNPTFVRSEIERFTAIQNQLNEKLRSVSPLQRTAVENDLAKTDIVLEALSYIDKHGFSPEDKELQKLAYFKKVITLHLEPSKTGRLAPSPSVAAKPGSSSPTTPSDYSKPAQPLEISFGERITIEDYLVRGKTVIFDFFSEFCGPCRAISPRMEELHKKRDDIVVVKVNINRSSAHGIDWQSPVAQQFKLHSIPSFLIYSPEGNLIAEGAEAYHKVESLISGNQD